MKSKELIQLLQEEDPTGEVEVCVNNVDIYFLTTELAGWDGCLQVLTRDHSKDPFYNITGARYVRSGSKIVLHPMSVRDVLWNSPDAVIDYSELSPVSRGRYEECDNKTRQASRDCEKRCEMDMFYQWVQSTAAEIHPGGDFKDGELREESDRFYEANLSPNDPLKELPPKSDKDGNMWHPSVCDCRESEWGDKVEVRWTGYWELHKKEVV